MTAKEYLSQVIKLKKKAESLARQIIELRVKAEGGTDTMKGGGRQWTRISWNNMLL